MNEAILNQAKAEQRAALDEAIQKYGARAVSTYEIEDLDSGELLTASFRQPSRAEIHQYQNALVKNFAQAAELLVKMLWVTGDAKLREDPRYLITIQGTAAEMLGAGQMRLKK